jgi:amino acid transporter
VIVNRHADADINAPRDLDSCGMTTLSLREECLALPQSVGQAIATVTISGGVALGVGVVFGIVGPAGWSIYVLTTIVMLIVASNLNVLSLGVSSTGGPAEMVRRSLGKPLGLVCCWALLTAYFFVAIAGAATASAYLFIAAGQSSIAPLPLTALNVAVVAACWTVCHNDIRFSTGIMLIIELITMSLLVIVLVEALLHVTLTNVSFQLRGHPPSQFVFGVALTLTMFAGFESASTLGVETRTPNVILPQTNQLSVIIVGIFFTMCAFALLQAFGNNAATLAESMSPFNDLAETYNIPWAGHVLALGVAVSFFAGATGCLTAGARLLYYLATTGALISRIGNVHKSHRTPHVAIAIISMLTLVGTAVAGLLGLAPKDFFAPIAAYSGVGFATAYLLICLAAMRKRYRAHRLSIARLAVDGIPISVLCVTLYGLFAMNDLTPPLSALPSLALISIGIGTVASFRQVQNPIENAIGPDK